MQRLVSIDSVNPGLGGGGEEEIALFVAEWAREAGFEVEFDEAAPRPAERDRDREGVGGAGGTAS